MRSPAAQSVRAAAGAERRCVCAVWVGIAVACACGMDLEAWNVNPDEFPRHGTPADQLEFAARYALLAPSSHNSQPWRFVIHGNRLDLEADRTRALPVVDCDDRELTISCGAALFQLRVALHYFGYSAAVDTAPPVGDPDLLAVVRLGEPRRRTADDERLFAAIARRHTNRGAFDGRELSEAFVAGLQEIARAHGAWLYWARGMAKEAVAALIAEGDRVQEADPRFRRELAAWLHPNRSESSDGMPGFAHGFSDAASLVVPLVTRTFDLGGRRAYGNHELAIGSPVLAVLGTDGDGVRDWLDAGQALAHLLLHATSEGVSASFLNQPVEVPELRRRLHDAIGKSGVPQLVLRLGYGPDARATPRRALGLVSRRTG